MNIEQGKVAKFAVGGSMFVNPSNTSAYKLYDLAISGPANKNIAKTQYIQFFQPASLKLDAEKAFYYWGGKWYYKNTSGSVVKDTEAADFDIPAGTGFLCAFGQATTKIQYAGQVLTSASVIEVARPTGAKFFFVVNPYPVAVNLSDIVISGPANKNIAKTQYIQFFQPSSLKLDQARAYYNWQGKWYYKNSVGEIVKDTEVVDFSIAPGEGFMCAFGQTTTKITLPACTIAE